MQEKSKSEFHFCSWILGLQNLDVIFENLLLRKFWKHFQAEIIPWSPIFLDFLLASSKVWKNEDSCQSWLVRFWVNRCSYTPIFSQPIFFFFLHFSVAIMDLKYLILFFLISYQEFQLVKNYFSIISTWRNIKLKKL